MRISDWSSDVCSSDLGSAPDIADRDIANPYGAILSVALLLRHSLGLAHEAGCLETAVGKALDAGALTSDLAAGTTALGTHAVAAAAVERPQEQHGRASGRERAFQSV